MDAVNKEGDAIAARRCRYVDRGSRLRTTSLFSENRRVEGTRPAYRGKTETDSDKKHRKFITDILNDPKNQAKHAGDPTKTEFEARLQAVSMIMRAVPTVERLGGSISYEVRRFRIWLRENPDL